MRLTFFPGAQQPANQDDLAQMICVVIRDQQGFAQNGLPGAVGNGGEQVGLGLATSFFIAARSRANDFRLLSHAMRWAVWEFPANTRQASPVRRAWRRAKILECPTARCACARAIPRRNRESLRDGLRGAWGRFPRKAAFQSTCASRPVRRSTRCSRRSFSSCKGIPPPTLFNLRFGLRRTDGEKAARYMPSIERFLPMSAAAYPFRN